MNRPLGRLGAAATLGQHCPQMTQRRCTIELNINPGYRTPCPCQNPLPYQYCHPLFMLTLTADVIYEWSLFPLNECTLAAAEVHFLLSSLPLSRQKIPNRYQGRKEGRREGNCGIPPTLSLFNSAFSTLCPRPRSVGNLSNPYRLQSPGASFFVSPFLSVRPATSS